MPSSSNRPHVSPGNLFVAASHATGLYEHAPLPAEWCEPTASVEPRNEIVMAVDIKEKGGVLGCAYYNSTDGSLWVLHDAPCAEPLQLVDALLVHVQPTMVLLPLKIPDAALRFFEESQVAIDADGTQRHSFTLRTLASSDFGLATSIDKLANLPLIRSEHAIVTTVGGRYGDGITADESQGIKAMRLSSCIDLDCVVSVGCAGAVLGQALRMKDAERDPGRSDIASLQMFTLSDFMFITTDTLAALQVFQSELHPSKLMSGTAKSSGSKESLSLYGIFNPLAGTTQGRAKLRQMFLRPLVNVEKIRERHRSISVFLRAENVGALKCMSAAIKRIKDIGRTLEELQRGADSPTGSASVDKGVWWTLARFSLRVLELRAAIHQLRGAGELAVVEPFLDSAPFNAVKAVGELIGSVIDFDEAKNSSRIGVRLHVDERLDRLKQTYSGLESMLRSVTDAVCRQLPEWARQHLTGCLFWPQLGFLTSVSVDAEGKAGYEGQELQDDLWERMFIANGNVYYKTRRMEELDNRFGDAYSNILDLEIEILHELACKVLVYAPVLCRISDACGDLDCLLALATGARTYGWTVPTMTTDNLIAINGGRHPLQELTVPSFIKNDCRVKGGAGDVYQQGGRKGSPESEDGDVETLIITGPNHSGKSVYIKQVALIVFLAHMGSFVPADQATIGITDQILTRISTRESVSQNESAFGIDLRQTSFLLKRATRRSLVLVDEFGKGTAADDGTGLMTGLIDHFSTLGSQTPRIIMTTHFHEMFEGGYLRDCVGLSVAHMDVRIDLNTLNREEQVTFLYALRPGRSTSSFGSKCAELNGVDLAVVERAEAIILLLARNEDIGAACAKLNAEEEAQLEKAEMVARKFLQLSLEDSPASPPWPTAGGGRQETLRGMLGDLLAPQVGR